MEFLHFFLQNWVMIFITISLNFLSGELFMFILLGPPQGQEK